MLLDDIIYVGVLLGSVAAGYFIQKVKDPQDKQFQSTLLGLIVVLIVSGRHIIHPIFTVIVNAFIVLCANKRYCHVISFIFCFGYLAFFRLVHYLGMESPPTHTNAIQMILTLKMVGLAFEAHESWRLSRDQTRIHRILKLSFLDIFHYSFCYAGVLIGPYYRFSTYDDMIFAPYQSQLKTTCWGLVKRRMRVLPLYMTIFLILNYLFPIEFVSSWEVGDSSFWYRAFYMSPTFAQFRMRMYSGFILGECVCIMIGLGVYPDCAKAKPGEGPTDIMALKKFELESDKWGKMLYNADTVHNIVEMESEFKPLIRDGIRSWNRTVQYWLAVNVHKKLPFSKPIRMTVTMLISSFWHGVHPGYYLCLMSAPLFLLAEAQMEKGFRRGVSYWRALLFDWLWWIVKMQAFAYMGMAFILLTVRDTFYYWMSIYFVGHAFVVLFYLTGTLVARCRPKVNDKQL